MITTLKELRMWHWRQYVKLNASSVKFLMQADIDLPNRSYNLRLARLREQEANLHLSAVNVLNASVPGEAAQDCSAAEDNKYNRGV